MGIDKNAGKFYGMIGTVTTAIGVVPKVAARLTWRDVLGGWKARWGLGRMNYQIPPGLYAVGNPGPKSPVLVSANYKMSFDRLRRELTGLDLWIMVIDTKGINVWCAAGKGTFGTEELARRIGKVGLGEVVTHRTIILPQLGAPGVAAHEVLKSTGFRVVYGPVRAKDLPAFLQAGQKATAAMREVSFGFWDRLAVSPIELVGVIKPSLILIGIIFIINLFMNRSAPFLQLVSDSLRGFVPYLGAILVGTIVVPAILPYIPGRALAWKGWAMGVLYTALYVWSATDASWKAILFYFLILPPLSSYLSFNYTGSTTYTSLSGVVKEMRVALPLSIISTGAGILFMVAGFFLKF